MTVLLLIFGELSPKVFAVTNSERFSLAVASPLERLAKVLALSIKLIQFLTNAIIEFLAPLNSLAPNSLTSNEFEMLFKLGAEAGEVRKRERKLVGDIFEFEETVVREVMTPSVEIDALKAGSSLETLVSLINRSRSARMPVYREHIDDVFSILDTKQFLLSGEKSIDSYCSDPFFVPESRRVKSLLQDFI